MSAAPVVLRVVLNAGHGLGNKNPGIYDSGTASCYGGEHKLVSVVADQVLDFYNSPADYDLHPRGSITVTETPLCSPECVRRHPKRKDGQRSGHLAFLIQYINENSKAGDIVLSLHLDDRPTASSGVLVVYDNGAPTKRQVQALALAAEIARVIGLPNLGAMPDTESARGSIAIVEDTHPPAFLVELGNINNEDDVKAVIGCAKEAVIAGIALMEKFH